MTTLIALTALLVQDTRANTALEGTALIDAMMQKAWSARNLRPAAPASDEAFFRRVTLDLTGTVPRPNAVRSFLDDKAKDKRARAIDKLLAAEGYGEHWANVWWRILNNGENPGLFAPVQQAFRDWLTDQFAAGVPWDKLVASMIVAEGNSDEHPEVWYLLQNFQVDRRNHAVEIAGPVTGHFLGIQMACARCHDHKTLPEMKQKNFYEMAAFFQNLSAFPVNLRETRENRMILPVVNVSDRRRAAPLRLPTPDGEPGGPAVSPVFYPAGIRSASLDSREAFAGLLTKNNLQFARAVTNRYWGFLTGQGLVSPGDGFAENTPSHPELLDALAKDLMSHGYDLKYLLRAICNSKVYQLSSETGGRKDLEASEYVAAALRPMAPHQLTATLLQITGADQMIGLAGGRMAKMRRTPAGEEEDPLRKKYMEEMAEKMLKDPKAGAKLMKRRAARDLEEAFAIDPDDIGSYKLSIQQALVLMNNDRTSANAVEALARSAVRGSSEPAERLEKLFLTILSRPLTAEERRSVGAYVKEDQNGEKYEDVAWALLNSSEFIFNH